VWQASEQHRVHHGERGDIQRDGDRQDGDRCDSERAIAAQSPKRQSQIKKESFQPPAGSGDGIDLRVHPPPYLEGLENEQQVERAFWSDSIAAGTVQLAYSITTTTNGAFVEKGVMRRPSALWCRGCQDPERRDEFWYTLEETSPLDQ
jgi:hypothetical protein